MNIPSLFWYLVKVPQVVNLFQVIYNSYEILSLTITALIMPESVVFKNI